MDLPIEKLWFSIAMLVYQRVIIYSCLILPVFTDSPIKSSHYDLAIRFDGDEPNSEPRTSHHRQAFSHKVSENNYCQFRGNLRFFVEKTSQEVFEMGIIPEVSRIHSLYCHQTWLENLPLRSLIVAGNLHWLVWGFSSLPWWQGIFHNHTRYQ